MKAGVCWSRRMWAPENYVVHFSALHLWRHLGSWKSAFGSMYSTKISRCYKSGPDINYDFMAYYKNKRCSSYACFPKHVVCVCVCLCVCVCVYQLLSPTSKMDCHAPQLLCWLWSKVSGPFPPQDNATIFSTEMLICKRSDFTVLHLSIKGYEIIRLYWEIRVN